MKRFLLISALLLAAPAARGQWVQVFNSSQDNDDGFLAAAGDTLFLHTMFNNIFRSTDHGITWTATDGAATDTLPDLFARLGLWVFKSDSSSGIIKSSDEGKNWSTCFSEGFGVVSNESVLFSTNGYGKLFISKDTGQSWDSVLEKDSVPVYNLAASENLLFDAFGDYRGEVYYSTDLGTTWNNTGTMHRVNNIILSGGNVVVSTTNTGLWWALLTAFVPSNSTVSNKLLNHSLTAYPNPFTHSTAFHFTSLESGYATVTLVNPLGEEVQRVFAGDLGAGEHSFPVTVPSGLAAGMYECVVRMNGRAEETGIIIH